LNTTLHNFFPEKYGGKIMVEITCEPIQRCNRDQEVYKGLLASDLAFVTRMAPYTAPEILPRLQGSAVGAAKQCTGGKNGTLCGSHWYPSESDVGDTEHQMSATSLFTSNLIAFHNQEAPETNNATSTEAPSPTSTADVNDATRLSKSSLGGFIALMLSISGLI
jgi:mannan endo-1,6-alpha-mannosidase